MGGAGSQGETCWWGGPRHVHLRVGRNGPCPKPPKSSLHSWKKIPGACALAPCHPSLCAQIQPCICCPPAGDTFLKCHPRAAAPWSCLYLLFSLQIAEWLTSHIIVASSLTVSDIYMHVACFPSVRYEKTPPRKAGTLPTAPSPAARPVPST